MKLFKQRLLLLGLIFTCLCLASVWLYLRTDHQQQNRWFSEQFSLIQQMAHHGQWNDISDRRHFFALITALPGVVAADLSSDSAQLETFLLETHQESQSRSWKITVGNANNSLLLSIKQHYPKHLSSLFWRITFPIITLGLCFLCYLIFLRITKPLSLMENKANALLSRHYKGQDDHILANSDVAIVNKLMNEYQHIKQQQLALSNQLRRLSFVDPVTGLGNREYFDAEFDVQIKNREEKVSGTIILLSFEVLMELVQKNKNKFDEFIKAVGSWLQNLSETQELVWVARRGTVDFAILTLENRTQYISRICQQMIKDLSRDIFDTTPYKNNYVNIGASFFTSGDDPSHVFSVADMALRHSQFEGYNKFHLYTADNIDPSVVKGGVHWRNFLQKILDKRAVTLFYQPQIRNFKDESKHFEVLARIQDQDKDSYMPGSVFLPMANRCGLVAEFDRLIIDLALKEMILSEEMQKVHLNINVFPESLLDKNFVEWLIQRIHQHTSLAQRITFEVNEFAVSRHLAQLKKPMFAIEQLGCTWCIEHVGSPNADLSYITELPVSALKLSYTLVRHVAKQGGNALFIRSIVNTAKNANMPVWAEGIESESEWNTLKEMGVSGAQGYWLGRPRKHI